MKVNKIVQKRTRAAGKGVNFVGDVNAVFSGNVGEGSSRTRVVSKQRIVQRSVKKTGRDDSLEREAEDG